MTPAARRAKRVGAGTYGDWAKAFKILGNTKKDLAAAQDAAILTEANFFRKEILRGLREQSPGGKTFKALDPHTIAMRKFLGFKGTKALLRHGDLRNAIAVTKVGNSVFVGVLKTAMNERGQSLANVADLNENGSKPIVIKITPKMRALLHAAFQKAGIAKSFVGHSTGIVVVQIPARPFVKPVFEEFGKPELAEKRIADTMAKQMKGKGWTALGTQATKLLK